MFFARVTAAKDVHHSPHPKVFGQTEEEAADELLVKDHRDPSHYTGLLKQYVIFSKYPLLLVEGKGEFILSFSVTIAILLAAVSIGLETYPDFQDSPVIVVINNCVLGVFILEFVLKVLSEGAYPQHYFVGPQRYWNIFDFVLIVITLPISDELNAGAVSRVFRLFRILKVARRIQALQVIIYGLLSGMSSIFFITILLSLVYYMYAVLGVFLYRESDPFYFGSIPRAIIGLFRACTLENWGDNMYISYYGCSKYKAGIYNTRDDFDSELDWLAVPLMYRCEHPKAMYMVAFFYWVSFIVVSSLVMLSLFIGVITLAMQASMTDMKEELEEQVRQRRVLEAEKAFQLFKVDRDGTQASTKRSGFISLARSFSSKFTGQASDPGDSDAPVQLSVQERRKQNDLEQMRKLLMQAWEGTSVANEYKNNLAKEQMESTAHFIQWLGAFCRDVLQHPIFANSVTLVIVLAGIMIGIDADLGDQMSPGMRSGMGILETVILSVFCIEFIIRFGADEFHIHEFIKSSWNIFDGVVILGSFLPQGGPLLMILRLLRLLRVLKLLKAFPRLAVIVGALLKGLGSIGYIGIIIIIGFYIFAVIGSIMFHDNDALHFGNVHLAFMTLCQVSTLDAWGEQMMKNIYGCDTYPNPNYASDMDRKYCIKSEAFGVLAVVFYVTFVIIGSLVMLTLFVGVVTTSMDEAAAEQAEEKEVEVKINELCLKSSVTSGQLEVYRRVFKILDADGGGSIDSNELKIGLDSIDINPTEEELDSWILDVDINGDGVVDIVEFITFMTNVKERHINSMVSAKMDPPGGNRSRLQSEDIDKASGKAGVLQSVPQSPSPKVKKRSTSFNKIMADEKNIQEVMHPKVSRPSSGENGNRSRGNSHKIAASRSGSSKDKEVENEVAKAIKNVNVPSYGASNIRSENSMVISGMSSIESQAHFSPHDQPMVNLSPSKSTPFLSLDDKPNSSKILVSMSKSSGGENPNSVERLHEMAPPNLSQVLEEDSSMQQGSAVLLSHNDNSKSIKPIASRDADFSEERSISPRQPLYFSYNCCKRKDGINEPDEMKTKTKIKVINRSVSRFEYMHQIARRFSFLRRRKKDNVVVDSDVVVDKIEERDETSNH